MALLQLFIQEELSCLHSFLLSVFVKFTNFLSIIYLFTQENQLPPNPIPSSPVPEILKP